MTGDFILDTKQSLSRESSIRRHVASEKSSEGMAAQASTMRELRPAEVFEAVIRAQIGDLLTKPEQNKTLNEATSLAQDAVGVLINIAGALPEFGETASNVLGIFQDQLAKKQDQKRQSVADNVLLAFEGGTNVEYIREIGNGVAQHLWHVFAKQIETLLKDLPNGKQHDMAFLLANLMADHIKQNILKTGLLPFFGDKEPVARFYVAQLTQALLNEGISQHILFGSTKLWEVNCGGHLGYRVWKFAGMVQKAGRRVKQPDGRYQYYVNKNTRAGKYGWLDVTEAEAKNFVAQGGHSLSVSEMLFEGQSSEQQTVSAANKHLKPKTIEDRYERYGLIHPKDCAHAIPELHEYDMPTAPKERTARRFHASASNIDPAPKMMKNRTLGTRHRRGSEDDVVGTKELKSDIVQYQLFIKEDADTIQKAHFGPAWFLSEHAKQSSNDREAFLTLKGEAEVELKAYQDLLATYKRDFSSASGEDSILAQKTLEDYHQKFSQARLKIRDLAQGLGAIVADSQSRIDCDVNNYRKDLVESISQLEESIASGYQEQFAAVDIPDDLPKVNENENQIARYQNHLAAWADLYREIQGARTALNEAGSGLKKAAKALARAKARMVAKGKHQKSLIQDFLTAKRAYAAAKESAFEAEKNYCEQLRAFERRQADLAQSLATSQGAVSTLLAAHKDETEYQRRFNLVDAAVKKYQFISFEGSSLKLAQKAFAKYFNKRFLFGFRKYDSNGDVSREVNRILNGERAEYHSLDSALQKLETLGQGVKEPHWLFKALTRPIFGPSRYEVIQVLKDQIREIQRKAYSEENRYRYVKAVVDAAPDFMAENVMAQSLTEEQSRECVKRVQGHVNSLSGDIRTAVAQPVVEESSMTGGFQAAIKLSDYAGKSLSTLLSGDLFPKADAVLSGESTEKKSEGRPRSNALLFQNSTSGDASSQGYENAGKSSEPR